MQSKPDVQKTVRLESEFIQYMYYLIEENTIYNTLFDAAIVVTSSKKPVRCWWTKYKVVFRIYRKELFRKTLNLTSNNEVSRINYNSITLYVRNDRRQYWFIRNCNNNNSNKTIAIVSAAFWFLFLYILCNT